MAVEPHEIVRVNDSMCALAGDIVNNLRGRLIQCVIPTFLFETYCTQTTQVSGVERACDTAGSKTLQQEGNTESIETLPDKVVYGAGARPGIICSKNSLYEVFNLASPNWKKKRTGIFC